MRFFKYVHDPLASRFPEFYHADIVPSFTAASHIVTAIIADEFRDNSGKAPVH